MSVQEAVGVPTGRAGFRDLVRARPLVWFFLLAFAFSWSTSLVVLVTGSGPPVLGFGPFLAALAVLGLTVGKPGVKDLFRSMVKWRVPVRWWAVALLTPVVLTGAATALNVALGAPMPTSEELGPWPDALITALLILFIPVIGVRLARLCPAAASPHPLADAAALVAVFVRGFQRTPGGSP